MLLKTVVFASTIVLSVAWLSSEYRYRDRHAKMPELNIGLIVRHTNFGVREYTRAVKNAITGLHKNKGHQFDFLRRFNFTPHHVHLTLMQLTPTPTGNTFHFKIVVNKNII